MSSRNSESDEEDTYSPDYERLEKQVEEAQSAAEEAEDFFSSHGDAIEAIEESLEDVEDIIDDAQDSGKPKLLGEADVYVDDTQTTIRHLEDQVDFSTNPDETAGVMNGLDNAVEDLEDALEEESNSRLVVQVSHKTFVPDELVMEPSEILEAAGFERDDNLLYYGADAEEDDPHVPKGTEVNLEEHNVFTSIPDETGYGGTTSDDGDDAEPELPSGLTREIADLREDYTVDVEPDAEEKFTWVIVRDYPIPSDGFNMDQTDTLLRIPENYPEQRPDWVYVEEDFRLSGGSIPKNGNLKENNENAEDVLDGWMSLSWHISNLDVEWVPYKTGLRWYLETIVHGRLSTGE